MHHKEINLTVQILTYGLLVVLRTYFGIPNIGGHCGVVIDFMWCLPSRLPTNKSKLWPSASPVICRGSNYRVVSMLIVTLDCLMTSPIPHHLCLALISTIPLLRWLV